MRSFFLMLAMVAILGGVSVRLPAFDIKILAIPTQTLPTLQPTLPALPTPTFSAAASANLPLRGVVNAQALNVRECASKSCRAISWIYKGDQVQIFAGKNSWVKIGAGQWVYDEYIDFKEAQFVRRH